MNACSHTHTNSVSSHTTEQSACVQWADVPPAHWATVPVQTLAYCHHSHHQAYAQQTPPRTPLRPVGEWTAFHRLQHGTSRWRRAAEISTGSLCRKRVMSGGVGRQRKVEPTGTVRRARFGCWPSVCTASCLTWRATYHRNP